MNSDARTAFRQGEIRAMNEAETVASDARAQARSDFRRREIMEMNTDDERAKMAKWGLLGLGAVVAIILFMQPSRSNR